MAGRLAHRLLPGICALALALMAAGCGSDDELSDDEIFGQTTATDAPSHRSGNGRLYDVGGHKLYMECRGSGSPTVVFLHGSVQRRGGGGRTSAGKIPALLENRHRVCTYDRANVGDSEAVRGPLTGKSSARDLHALLRAAHVPGPYLLLGASLGGSIADTYAAAYPKDVTGMVLLDSTLPAYLPMYKRQFSAAIGPKPGDWKSEAERLDRLTTYRQAAAWQARKQRIPVTYIAARTGFPREIDATILRAQRAFVDRFSPGRLIVLGVPHSMVRVIPTRIAREVERVSAASKRR